MNRLTKQQQAEAFLTSEEGKLAHSFNFCALRTTINVLGGKWKFLILSYLMDGPKRYGELKRLIPEITEKMLIGELRELEADLIVQRKMYHQVPPKVEYTLTDYGQAMRPVIESLLTWGETYMRRNENVPAN